MKKLTTNQLLLIIGKLIANNNKFCNKITNFNNEVAEMFNENNARLFCEYENTAAQATSQGCSIVGVAPLKNEYNRFLIIALLSSLKSDKIKQTISDLLSVKFSVVKCACG